MNLIDWINGVTKLNKATMDEFQNNIKAAIDAVKLEAHPVGSYYWSSENTNPETLFGGTWVQIKDKFILALGDTYTTVGATGGNTTTTLSVNNLPSHSHTENSEVWMNSSGTTNKYITAAASGGNYCTTESVGSRSSKNTGSTGSGASFSNMPPYEVAYCWKRTA